MPQSPPIRRAEQLGVDVELRVVRNDGWRMSPRWHADLQVIATMEGTGQAFVGDGPAVVLPPGSLIVIPPLASHTAFGLDPGEWAFHSLHVSPERLASANADGDSTPRREHVAQRGTATATAFSRLIESLFSARRDAVVECRSFLATLGTMSDIGGIDAGDGDALGPVAARLKSDLAGDVSIDRLASEHGCSAGHLSRAFKAAYGMPPHRWRINARVEAAKRALRAGVSLADAAKSAGFSDASHLARHFKSWTGLPPRSFRRRR